MKPTIKDDCTHAYAGIVVLLVAIFMLLFTAVMHGQNLPNAPQVAVKHPNSVREHAQGAAGKARQPGPGSADWFRERGYFKLARFIPMLKHIAWHFGNDKPKEPGHRSRKSR